MYHLNLGISEIYEIRIEKQRLKRHFLKIFEIWYRKEEKIFRHSWKSPPRIFKKQQSQNWSSYHVSTLKIV